MKNNKFWYGVITGLASALLMVTIVCGVYWMTTNSQSSTVKIKSNSTTTASSSDTSNQKINYSLLTNKIKLLEQYIDKYYMSNGKPLDVSETIYKGVLASLNDPYSVYYTKDEYASMMESTNGSYCGIGAYVSQDVKTGIITIVKPFENGPAHEAGVLPGDTLYKVEGKEVTGQDLTDVVSRMKGKENTKVKITVIHQGEKEPVDMQVTRRSVEVPTISYKMMDDKIGYIQITEFDEVTAKQFRSAMDDLEKKGMVGLVIDLRDNPGGRLDTVVDILDRIVKKGLLVYTKDKNGEGEKYNATDKTYFDKPLSVLINGNSASASEVFSGAIQDYKLGTLVGTTSFGKGIVQSVIPLADGSGSAIKLTIAKYYTPKGRNIHGKGIDPDVKCELSDKAKSKIVLKPSEDNQLQKAISVIKKKIK
ncbi:carboxyl-terminal protease [Lachnospiraceae bacterium KM106-2]|nr:carboxyl-terminal protease [Lachnospiraceae bacterium KM106-2]